jgi:hypothetical protein
MVTETVALRPITGVSPWRGLPGLTGAEVRRWLPWRTLVLVVVGLAVLAAAFAIWWFAGSQNEVNYRLGSLMYSFFAFWGVVLTLAVTAAAQGAVAGEVDEGTAAWLIGMPVGRPAFIVSKVLGAIPGIVLAVFGTGLIAYPVLSYAANIRIEDFTARDVLDVADHAVATEGFANLPAASEYVGMLTRMALFLLVLVAVMVLLGAMFRSQMIVLGLGVALAGGLFAVGLLDVAGLTGAAPAGLISGLLDAVRAEPAPLALPVLVSLLWIAGLTALAVLRFQWREL